MKAVILAGGLGTRISEESHLRPKPMIEIGGSPILWHIMKIYSCFGCTEFIICCGYMGYMIKEYFADYYLHHSDVTFDFSGKNEIQIHSNVAEPWKVTVVDTGLNTQTGGRIRRIRPYIGNETFFCTYGDGVADLDLQELLHFHREGGRYATITAVQPGSKFGVLDLEPDGKVGSFVEKNKEDGNWINAGFMVLEPEIFDFIDGDMTALEREPFENLARLGQLDAYKHSGFWQCMDTQRDKFYLESLIEKGEAKWIKW